MKKNNKKQQKHLLAQCIFIFYFLYSSLVLAEASKIFLNETQDIYIGVGKEGLAPTKIPRVMEVDANVLADKIKNL